jgi:N-acetylneuraminic acid mutarotase
MSIYKVFLSHTREDQETALHVCAVLEAEGIQCWLASRDAISSDDAAAVTLEAIRNSDLVLLIFSVSANASPYVLREIERAIAYERPVLSIHLDDSVPNASLEYYLNLWQWLEAPGGVEGRNEEIVTAVRRQLAGPSRKDKAPLQTAAVPPEAAEKPDSAGEAGAEPAQGAASLRRSWRRTWVIALVSAVVVAAIGLGLGLGLQRHTIWTELLPSGALPDGRAKSSVAYESSRDSVIVFGGINTTGRLSDTWAYDPVGNQWTDLDPPGTAPSPRDGGSMAYDPNTKTLILFGGFGDQDLRSDTWAYDPAANRWTALNPSGAVPHPRAGQSMVYDPITRRIILFGGVYLDSTGTEELKLNDTWAYDPAANSWAELKPAGTPPSARAAQATAYDSSKGLMIIFGGVPPGAALNDTWAYDPARNSWTELRPSGTLPEARYGASMVYDPPRGRMVMFGGRGDDLLADTWEYDSSTNSWTEVKRVGEQPEARWAPTLVFSEPADHVVMFGGAAERAALMDTWAYTR